MLISGHRANFMLIICRSVERIGFKSCVDIFIIQTIKKKLHIPFKNKKQHYF
jgi:hypothetical protein